LSQSRENRAPYPGLRAFGREEADLFFGRDGAVDQMVDTLEETRFLAVLGSSGAGKSSLVLTGLLDGLELGLHTAGSDWTDCVFTPGGRPFTNLATALCQLGDERQLEESEFRQRVELLETFLRRGPHSLKEWWEESNFDPGRQLLLVVDQFEELFRFEGYSDRENAEAFSKLLIETSLIADLPIHVVITMRSEFLGACALIPGLAETINKGAYLTPRMDRAGYREAIIGPAKMMDVSLDDALVARILRDIVSFAPWGSKSGDDDQLKRLSRRADQLPVMQHLMNRLWQIAANRPGDEVHITLADYEEIGGLRGALDAHGAEIMSSFSAREELIVGRLFRALVDGNSIATATRRPQSLQELIAATETSQTELTRLIDRFRSADCNFLRPSVAQPLEPDTVIDISHESLIRQWSRLSDWVTEEARAASLWSRLAEAAELHRTGEGDLLHGLTLSNLSTWWEEDKPSRAWSERYPGDFDEVSKFLEASRKEERREIAEDEEEDRIQRNRLRMGFGVVSVLAVVATFLAFAISDLQRETRIDEEASVTGFQGLVLGVFKPEMDIETLHGLILERDEALTRWSERYSDNPEFNALQFEYALRATQSLSDAWWFDEAELYASVLKEQVASDIQNQGWKPSPELKVEALIALANLSYHRGRLAEQADYLIAAEAAYKDVDFNEYARSFFEVELTSARVAHHSAKYEFQLRENYLTQMNEALDDFASRSENALAQFEDLLKTRETLVNQTLLPGFSEDLERSVWTFYQAHHNQRRKRLGRALKKGLIANGETLRWINANFHLKDRFPEEYESFVERTEKIGEFAREYLDEDDPARIQIQANLAQIIADRFSEEDDEDSEYLSRNDAVGLANTLHKSDESNTYYWHLLRNTLVSRAATATSLEQFTQAKSDLDNARALQNKITLEQFILAPYLEQGTSEVYRRYNLLEEDVPPPSQSEEVAKRSSDLSRLRASYETHIDFHEARSEAPVAMSFRRMIWAWMSFSPDAWEQQDATESDRIVMEVISSFSPSDAHGDLAYLGKVQRRYLAYRIVNMMNKFVIDERLVELVEQSIEEAEDMPDISFWRAFESHLLIRLGRYSNVMEQNYPKSVSSYLKAIEQLISIEGKHLENEEFATRALLAVRELLESNHHPYLDVEAMRLMVDLSSTLEHYAFYKDAATHLLTAITRAEAHADWILSQTDADPEHQEQLLDLLEILRGLDQKWNAQAASRSPGISDAPQGQKVEMPISLRAQMSEDAVRDESYRAWYNPTIFPGAWWTLSDAELSDFRQKFIEHFELDESWFDSVVFVRRTELSFYDGLDLVELERLQSGEKAIYPFLVGADDLIYLNGQSTPIYEATGLYGLTLETPQQASAYLRFFCSYLSAGEGAFPIIDYVQDLAWLPSATYEDMAAVERKIQPLSIWKAEKDDQPGWSAMVVIQYASAIFQAEMFIPGDGKVEMVNDTPILADLPIFPISTLNRRPFSLTDIVSVDLSADQFVVSDDEHAWVNEVGECLEEQNCDIRDELIDYYAAIISDDRLYDWETDTDKFLESARLHEIARELVVADRVPMATVKMTARSVELDFETIDYKATRAIALFQSGQTRQAIAAARSCVAEARLMKDDDSATLAECLFLKGQALAQMGQMYAAVPAFAEAERYGVPDELRTLFDASSPETAAGNE